MEVRPNQLMLLCYFVCTLNVVACQKYGCNSIFEEMCRDGTCVSSVSLDKECEGRGGRKCGTFQRYCGDEIGCFDYFSYEAEGCTLARCGSCNDESGTCVAEDGRCPSTTCPYTKTFCNGICVDGYSCAGQETEHGSSVSTTTPISVGIVIAVFSFVIAFVCLGVVAGRWRRAYGNRNMQTTTIYSPTPVQPGGVDFTGTRMQPIQPPGGQVHYSAQQQPLQPYPTVTQYPTPNYTPAPQPHSQNQVSAPRYPANTDVTQQYSTPQVLPSSNYPPDQDSSAPPSYEDAVNFKRL